MILEGQGDPWVAQSESRSGRRWNVCGKQARGDKVGEVKWGRAWIALGMGMRSLNMIWNVLEVSRRLIGVIP